MDEFADGLGEAFEEDLRTDDDGYGLLSTFEFTKLSSPVVHRVSSSAVFPVRNLARPGFVVAKMLRDGFDPRVRV